MVYYITKISIKKYILLYPPYECIPGGGGDTMV